MRRRTRLFILLLVTSAGCLKPPNMATQIAHALGNDHTKEPWIGEIDADLGGVSGRESASSLNSDTRLRYTGIDNGNVCFSFEYWNFFRSNDMTVDGSLAKWVAAFQKLHGVIEAREKLDDVTDASAWPDRSLNHIKLVRLVSHELKTVTSPTPDERGIYDQHDELHSVMEMCGTAPTLGSAARFLTVTMDEGDKGGAWGRGGRALFIWRLAPDHVVLGAAPTTPTTPTNKPPGNVTNDAPAATPSSYSNGTFAKAALKHRGNFPTAFDVMVASNKFSTLIRIVKAAGLEDQLKSSAALTVFAPNDAAFAKLPKSELDRWSTAAGEQREEVRHRLLRHFVAADLVDLTRLTAFDSLARPHATPLKITHAGSSILVDDATVLDGKAARNGAVFEIDTVLPVQDNP